MTTTGKNHTGFLGQVHSGPEVVYSFTSTWFVAKGVTGWKAADQKRRRHGVKNTHLLLSMAINCDCIWRVGCSDTLPMSLWLFSFLLSADCRLPGLPE